MDKRLHDISTCIVDMDEDRIEGAIRAAVEGEIPLEAIYDGGLNHGMVKALEMFDQKVYHLPEVIVCADTLNKGLKVLKTYGTLASHKKATIVFAVVKGDTHEIGKNIVKIMLEASGYKVIDLGVNVDSQKIIDCALDEKADIIALSSMMTTTMGEMACVVDKLKAVKASKIPLVIIGGGCISPKYARDISADGYSENGPKAVKLVEELLGGGRHESDGVY